MSAQEIVFARNVELEKESDNSEDRFYNILDSTGNVGYLQMNYDEDGILTVTIGGLGHFDDAQFAPGEIEDLIEILQQVVSLIN